MENVHYIEYSLYRSRVNCIFKPSLFGNAKYCVIFVHEKQTNILLLQYEVDGVDVSVMDAQEVAPGHDGGRGPVLGFVQHTHDLAAVFKAFSGKFLYFENQFRVKYRDIYIMEAHV